MDYFKDLVWLYCNNPGSSQNKDEILSIVETRTLSLYQRRKFDDVMSQIESILDKCMDCRILAQLLILLQELMPKAKTEIATLWRSVPDRYVKNYKLFFIHDRGEQRSCNMCSLVQSSSAYLDRELASVNINKTRSPSTSSNGSYHPKKIELEEPKTPLVLTCVSCKANDIKRITLSCGHALCRNCASNAIKKITDSAPEINHFICPVDRNLCGLKSLETKLAEGQGSHISLDEITANPAKAVGFNLVQKPVAHAKVTCPKCDEAVDHTPNDGLLGECLLCNFCFCTKCRQAFHGNSKSCSTSSASSVVSFTRSDSRDSSTRNNPIHQEASKGASVKQYELDFYKNSVEDLFDVVEIQEAFQAPFLSGGDKVVPPAPKWPWETVLSSAEGRTPTPSLQYPHPYESLRVGHWVEDELLEKVLEIILHENDMLQSRVTILESFVLNWSLRKKQSGDELPRILREKQIFKKTLVFALINTDIRGHGGHWMLAVVFVQKHKILLFDSSLVLSPEYYQKYFFGLLHILHIAHQVQDQGTSSDFDYSKWRLFVSLDAVQQNNAYDCGPLVVCNAYALATWGTQLDRVPKSYMVREWLHHTLSSFGKKNIANGKKVEDKEGSEHGYKSNLTVKPYAPKGLTIRFKFFKNYELI